MFSNNLKNCRITTMSVTFEEKLDALTLEVDKATAAEGGKSKCFSIPLIAGIATPFILAGVLWTAKPGFVTKKINDKPVVDFKKLLQWTIVMSIIIWLALYLYTYCQDSGTSLMCLLGTK